MKYDMIELHKQVSDRLTKKRYLHTLGVTYTAASLAMRYGADIKKAELAGLFHDYAKCMPDEQLLEKCRKYHLPVSEIESRNAYLLHGKLAAYYVSNKFGIDDEDIQNAAAYHTTGRPNMSLLEEIVFLADYIEPNRKIIPGLDEIRTIAFVDIEQAIMLALKNTISYLESGSRGEIDPLTYESYEYYKSKINK